ncbi:MAG TPA: linear amide C-N hydrolase [Victivallales bacterium]|nr:linear amide C-N hydrolase [Victivallales bacterium]
MKVQLKLIITIITGMLFLQATQIFACTGIFINRSQKISARNYDFNTASGTLAISPIGTEHVSNTNTHNQKPLRWKTKYGNVIFYAVLTKKGHNTPRGKNTILCGIDGTNQYGFNVGIFYLGETKYLSPNNLPVLDAGMWTQYFLDNFRTVKKAVQFLKTQKKFRVISCNNKDINMDLHYFIHDKTGASAIVEYLNGRLKIIENPKVNVIANTPYDKAMEKLKDYISFGGTKTIPGGFESIQRFVRGAYYLHNIPKKTGKKYSLVDAAIEVIQSCTQPPVQEYPLNDGIFFPSMTCWTIVSNLTNNCIYYRTLDGPNFKEINLNKINFKEGGKERYHLLKGKSI